MDLEQRSTSVPLAAGASAPKAPTAKTNRVLWSLGGVAALLLLWQVLAASMSSAVVASPYETLLALSQLVSSGQLWAELVITLRRLIIALALGSGLGFGLGMAAGVRAEVRAFLEPLRWVAMALPTIFIAVLGMLWFGMGDTQVIFLLTVLTAPMIYVNMLAGIDGLDRQLLEMAQVFRFSRRQRFREIYLPGIGSSILAGLTLAAGMGVRAVIMAELLGAFEGVGHSFNRAWTYLKTPEMFAWITACLALMAILEFGVLTPVRRHLMRWRGEAKA